MLVATQDVDKTFAKIEKDWSCLSTENLTLCKNTTIMAFNMEKNGRTESEIRNAMFFNGSWAAGILRNKWAKDKNDKPMLW